MAGALFPFYRYYRRFVGGETDAALPPRLVQQLHRGDRPAGGGAPLPARLGHPEERFQLVAHVVLRRFHRRGVSPPPPRRDRRRSPRRLMSPRKMLPSSPWSSLRSSMPLIFE